MRIFVTATALLLFGCAQLPKSSTLQPVASNVGAEPSVAQLPSGLTPVVDHHTHLIGPFALPLHEPVAPEVSVPPEVAKLLERRAALYGNVSTEDQLKEVYTDDAMVVNTVLKPTGWMRQPYWFVRFFGLFGKNNRRFVPSAFSSSGSVAQIAGTLYSEPLKRHTTTFLFALRKGKDGNWRIALDHTAAMEARFRKVVTADDLIAQMDAAGINRSVVLTVAYWLGSKGGDDVKRLMSAPDPATAVQKENEWAAEQVARYADRLALACGINPLQEHSVASLTHCAKLPQSVGVKLNFGDSGVSFDRPEHIETMRRFFAAANQHKLALIVHLDPARYYGPKEVELFLSRIASAAPDVTIQLAHMAGDGPGLTAPDALAAFAERHASGDPRTRNLYYDLGGIVTKNMDPDQAKLLASMIRKIGPERILFASDSIPGVELNPVPEEQWRETLKRLPLSPEEFRTIAGNVAPYLRAPAFERARAEKVASE